MWLTVDNISQHYCHYVGTLLNVCLSFKLPGHTTNCLSSRMKKKVNRYKTLLLNRTVVVAVVLITRLWKHTEFRTYSFFVPV